jgi:NADH-quinone oxidoreductase subunit N
VVSGYFAVAIPATAVIVLLRLLDEAVPPDLAPVSELLRAVSIASILIGHGLALAARAVRRMLAGAGIAHAGHLALGLSCASAEAFEAVLFYVFVYAFIALGAHGLVASLMHGGREVESVDDFAGLARTRPLAAIGLSLFLLALAGLPGTAGFWAIFNLFSAALADGAVLGVGVALVGVAVSWRYLLAIPYAMVSGAAPSGRVAGLSTAEIVVLSVCAAVVLYLGWQPAPGLADVLSVWVN